MVKPRTGRGHPGPEEPQDQSGAQGAEEETSMASLGAVLATHTAQFERILTAIQDTKAALEAKIDTVALDVGVLRVEHGKLADRVREVESVTTKWSPELVEIQQNIRALSDNVEVLQRRAEEAEGRSRRNNVRFMGFAEGSETPDADLFLENWLATNVFGDKTPKFFSVERSHRVPGRPPPPGAPARPIIARLLNFRDRDLILQLFRTKGPFVHGNSTISAYPDFTAEVQRRRATYMMVKRQLRSLDIKYALLFPARLKVIYDSSTHFFSTPEDTWTWLHAKGLATRMPAEDEGAEWRIPKQRKRRNRGGARGPTRSQSDQERSGALEAVVIHVQNSFSPLLTEAPSPESSDGLALQEYLGAEGPLPELTPRAADDLG